jgi:tetratricopeptide (TPR) repeat protein
MDPTSALERASVLCDLGRWDDAAGHLATILANDPHNEQGLGLMARAQLGQKAYDQALQTALAAISENPENDWPHRTASMALTRLRRDPEAQAMARTAVRLAPHEAHCHRVLAQALAWNGSDLGEARAAADRAVSLAPHDADCHTAVGLVALTEARNDEAIAAYQRALALEPDNAIARNGLAKLQLMTRPDRLAQVAALFADLVGSNPREEVGRRNLDLVLYLFLGRTTTGLLVVACFTSWVRSHSDAGLTRLLPALLLVLPAFLAARFVSRLGPQLRGYLLRLLGSPVMAVVVVCDTIAATGLVVGATSQRASSIAFFCAVAFSVLARVILWHQFRSRFGTGSKVPRALWWVATAALIVTTQLVITQLTFGPHPTPMTSTEVVLRVAAVIGSVVVVYAVHRRRK